MEDYKKKYEDLITSLKKAKDDEMVRDDRFCVVIDNIVPALKESEDEKIRKELIEALKQLDREKTPVDTYPYFEWVAWLEKQGEQKPQGKPALEVWKDMLQVYHKQVVTDMKDLIDAQMSMGVFSLTIDKKYLRKLLKSKDKWPSER